MDIPGPSGRPIRLSVVMITLSVPRPVTLSGSPSDERVSLDVALSMAVVASTSSTLSTDRVGLDSQHAAAALITRSSWYPTMAVALLPCQVNVCSCSNRRCDLDRN